MENMTGNKQGILYTLTLSLLAFLLLGLALLLPLHQQASSKTISQLYFLQKMHDTDESAQRVISAGFLHTTGISLDTGSTFASVSETLPVSFAETDQVLEKSKFSLEQTFLSLNVSLGPFTTSRMLLISPLNISYIHVGTTGGRIPFNQNITGYLVSFVFAENISSCSPISETGGTLRFAFTARAPNTICSWAENSALSANVHLDIAGKGVGIELKNDGLSWQSNATVHSIINVSFTPVPGSYVELPVTISISDQAYNFSKQSYVRILD